MGIGQRGAVDNGLESRISYQEHRLKDVGNSLGENGGVVRRTLGGNGGEHTGIARRMRIVGMKCECMLTTDHRSASCYKQSGDVPVSLCQANADSMSGIGPAFPCSGINRLSPNLLQLKSSWIK